MSVFRSSIVWACCLAIPMGCDGCEDSTAAPSSDLRLSAEPTLPFEVTRAEPAERLPAPALELFDFYRTREAEHGDPVAARWGESRATDISSTLLPGTTIVRLHTWLDAGHDALPDEFFIIRDRHVYVLDTTLSRRPLYSEESTVVEIRACPPSHYPRLREELSGVPDDEWDHARERAYAERCLDLTRDLSAAARDASSMTSLSERGADLARVVMTLQARRPTQIIESEDELPAYVHWSEGPREPGTTVSDRDGRVRVDGLAAQHGSNGSGIFSFQLLVGDGALDLSEDMVGVTRPPQN